MGTARIFFDTAVICEQTRPEPAGKFMLLGVISGDLAMPSFPAMMAIAIYLEGEVLTEGDFVSTLRVMDEDDNVLFTLPQETLVKFNVGRFSYRLQMSIPLPKPCVIRVIAETSGEFQKILTRNVVVLSTTPPLPLPRGMV